MIVHMLTTVEDAGVEETETNDESIRIDGMGSELASFCSMGMEYTDKFFDFDIYEEYPCYNENWDLL
jgi:hypothetical protein